MHKPKGFAVTGTAKVAGAKGGAKSKGRKLTPEHIEKVRQAHLRRWEKIRQALAAQEEK